MPEDTGAKILEAALELFREKGFEAATMREIAAQAQVATGAAYYYYPSKDAIVMDFYRRSCDDMQPKIAAAIADSETFEAKLGELIRVKMEHFAANRGVLRALLRNGADPQYPLSPFSAETHAIREIDLAWFREIQASTKVPRDLEPHLPEVLWFFQMGLIYFWVIDPSPGQARTSKLLALSTKSVAALLKLSSLPLMRPLRKVTLEIILLVKGEA